MRILITGKDGQVGRELLRQPWPGCELIAVGREGCDLSNSGAVRDLVRRVAPQVIVNAAAYTAVDRAETDREHCFAVNATAPAVLAEEAADLDALLIHYSTDYVFNGEKAEPYVELDAIQPLSVYGESKAAGEAAIAAAEGRSWVLRTAWVYSAHGRNFLHTMLRLAEERPELRVVDDQVGAPTSAGAIADATARLVQQSVRQSVRQGASQAAALSSGIYHMTASGSTTWCGFAQAIFAARTAGPKPRVLAIASSEYPTPAKRPKNSILSNDKFERTFGFRLDPWQKQLERVLADMPARQE